MYWDPMWGISILGDFIPMGYKLPGFHAAVVFGLYGLWLLKKNILWDTVKESATKSILEILYPEVEILKILPSDWTGFKLSTSWLI